ncbi:putative transposase, probable fragment [Erwinia pyrifoliae Ep1/96]|nr:putative transposase, probable fragment [Erwinia pyrifoliae Ep1/96]
MVGNFSWQCPAIDAGQGLYGNNSLEEAQNMVEPWRLEYHQQKTYSSLNNRTAQEFALSPHNGRTLWFILAPILKKDQSLCHCLCIMARSEVRKYSTFL